MPEIRLAPLWIQVQPQILSKDIQRQLKWPTSAITAKRWSKTLAKPWQRQQQSSDPTFTMGFWVGFTFLSVVLCTAQTPCYPFETGNATCKTVDAPHSVIIIPDSPLLLGNIPSIQLEFCFISYINKKRKALEENSLLTFLHIISPLSLGCH